MKLICPNCGSKYDSGKFCLACGSPLSEVVVKKVLFCPVCQTEETSGKFCTTCGSKLEEREIEIAGDNYSQTTNIETSPVNDTQMDDEVEAIVAKYRDEHGNIRKLNPEEYPIAAEELQRCASKGNLEAICFLAELYLKGGNNILFGTRGYCLLNPHSVDFTNCGPWTTNHQFFL